MFDEYYNDFKNIFSDKNAKYRNLHLDGRDYFVNVSFSTFKLHRKEPDLFWHISSIGNEAMEEMEFSQKYNDMAPCVNTYFQTSCLNACFKTNTTFMKDQRRFPCEYRSSCVKLIRQVLEDILSDDPNIKVWRYKNRIFARKFYGVIDFVVIFDEKINNTTNKGVLHLITAFPIQLNSKKANFDKQYIKGKIK